MAALFIVAMAIALLPAPEGLSRQGQRVLAVVALAIGLWATALVPPGVTALVVVVALSLSDGVPSLAAALSGFADPVAYFLLGVLTIGLAVSKSGLAERVARVSLERSGGHPRVLYGQMLLAFPVLTLILPSATVLALLLAAAAVRLLIPNITGFLALTIPVAMSIGEVGRLNPEVCGLVVMIAGDAVLYYPAQSASSLVVYERGHLTAPEIFRFGVWMTLIAFVVVLAVAIPYWALVGEPLVARP